MHQVGFVIYPGVTPMTFAAATAFEIANWRIGSPFYEIAVVSEQGGAVATSFGPAILTSPLGRRTFDTLIVAGGTAAPPPMPGLAKYLRWAADRTGRIGSICTGAFVLAEALLLDRRRATTHWYHAEDLQRRYPEIKVDADRIFINDGPIWTSAGMSAGVDLALALVEIDLGAAVARSVAKLLVVYHRRAGGQSQYSTLLDLDAESDRIQTALTYAKKHLSERLSVDDLARVAFLSARQFSRIFTKETGQSPARAIERLRVESARLMMEAGRFPAEEIARKNGFGNRERMRRSFVRTVGQPPQAIQRVSRVGPPSVP